MTIRERYVFFVAVGSIALAALGGSHVVAAEPSGDVCAKADLVLSNALIYTGNAKGETASAVVTSKGRIVAVGDARKLVCPQARTVDLKGAFVYPGFTDSHIHLLEVGYREQTLNLRDAKSLKEAMDWVRIRAQQGQPGQWVQGVGWIEKYWPEKRFANRHDLDAVANDRPIFLERSDGHTALVNSYALRLAGIDRNSPDPSGGIVQREPNGEPNGILVDGAIALVSKLIPPKTAAQDKEALRIAIERNVRLGWTQTQNAGGSYREIGILKELAAEGKLANRLYYALDDDVSIQKLLTDGAQLDADHRLTVRGIKLFADGALGSRGAAMQEKFADDDSTGLMLLSREQVMPILTRALAKGIQVETHAIGDRANHEVLNWYEEAFRTAGRTAPTPRWRIEHVQVIKPEDQDRLKQLQVIPSMQPSHAIGDMYFAPTRLGPERSKNAYVWQGLIERGLIIAGGSDAPVEEGDPRIEFYAAVVRKDLNGYSTADWHTEQAVSRDVALKMFTIWPAYAAFEEDVRGSIEVGKLADFTIFDKDLMTVPAAQIISANVLMTVVGGRIVYRRGE